MSQTAYRMTSIRNEETSRCHSLSGKCVFVFRDFLNTVKCHDGCVRSEDQVAGLQEVAVQLPDNRGAAAADSPSIPQAAR